MNIPSKRPRLLFVCLEQTSFVRDDLQILQESYDVSVFSFDAHQQKGLLSRGTRLVRCIAEQSAWLWGEISRADVVYGWFADYHMLLPVIVSRLQNVPVVVMLGGMDCNHLPAFDYGIWHSSWRATLSRYVLTNATQLITPDSSLLHWSSTYTSWPEQHEDGLEKRVGDRHAPVSVIPLGFDPSFWPPGQATRERSVLTVAFIKDERTFRIKGLDHLLVVARELPDVTFRIVGIRSEYEQELREKHYLPQNVELLPPCDRSDLSQYYQQASVYAQLSRIESFGMVVGEAMLSGCVPVVSDVGALPKLVGSHGFVINRPEISELLGTFQQALSESGLVRKNVRQHIADHFHISIRMRRLTALLKNATY